MSAYYFSNRKYAKLLLLGIEVTWVFLGVTFRQTLKHSLVGVPRKMVLLKFEIIKRDE